MRRIEHRAVPVPDVLLGPDADSARRQVQNFLQATDEQLSTRRAPVNAKIYADSTVRKSLDALQFGKCAYCETSFAPVAPGDVEHHRPRANASSARKHFPHHYSWLAYEWENLLLVCADCNRRKRDLFPLRGKPAPVLAPLHQIRAQEKPDLLDPGFDRLERHLDFTLDGTCHPRTRRGGATISLLELNRSGLVEQRKLAFMRLADEIMHGPPVQLAGAWREALDEHAEFAGALRIIAFRYALELARRVRFHRFFFETFVELLEDLHRNASADDVRASLEILRAPRETSTSALQASRVEQKVAPSWIAPLRRIEIRNFKAIEKLDIDLPHARSDGEGATCLMLLGENAAGKSTVLEAVTMALCGTDALKALDLKPGDYVPRSFKSRRRGRTPETSVRVEFWEGAPAELLVRSTRTGFEGTPQASARVLAYGSRRYFIPGRRHRVKSGGDVGCLFDPLWVLPHPDLWLRTLEEGRFKSVARALREVLSLPDEADIDRDEERGVFIKEGETETPIERHSDGYRSLFATAVDVMRGVLGGSDLLEARGVVVIDEIETHLHPRWKLRVMSALRSALPQIQFIATTHDPLCLRGMVENEVQVLARDADGRIASVPNLPSVRGMRAEQLLTSEYFGLSSTADPEVELHLARAADAAERAPGITPDGSALNRLAQGVMLGDTAEQQVAAEAMREFISARDEKSPPEASAARSQAVAAFRAMLDAAADKQP